MKPSVRLEKFQWHDGFVCSAVVRLSYRLSAAASWNCSVVCGLMRLTVLTVSVVPAGIVPAFKDAAETQAQQVTISTMNLFCIIFCFERLICKLCRRNG